MSQELPQQINANDPEPKDVGFMAKLSKSAGAASKLVALQAERTKLTTLTLPAAYRALGKDCLQQKRHLDCIVELTSQLRSVLDEIKKLAEVAPGQPVPQSFTDKAKAAGKYAVDTARQKQLGMKRDSLIANIGKAIYEKHSDASGPIELVEPIASSIARIAQIDSEIGQQSAVGKGSFVTPKRMLIGVGLIVALLAVYLIVPRNSKDSEWEALSDDRRAAAIKEHEPKFLQMLQAGDSAWDAGKKPEAVQHYSQLLAQFCGHGQSDRTEVANLHKPDMARVAGRAIDFLADSGNDETAKDLIRKAAQSDLVVVYSSSKVNRLVKESKADQLREDKEVDDWLKEEGPNAPGGDNFSATKTLSEDELKSLSFDEIYLKMGPPDEEYTSRRRSNQGLAIWETADNEYTVVSFIKAIDGSSSTLVLTVHTGRHLGIVNQMKKAIDTPR